MDPKYAALVRELASTLDSHPYQKRDAAQALVAWLDGSDLVHEPDNSFLTTAHVARPQRVQAQNAILNADAEPNVLRVVRHRERVEQLKPSGRAMFVYEAAGSLVDNGTYSFKEWPQAIAWAEELWAKVEPSLKEALSQSHVITVEAVADLTHCNDRPDDNASEDEGPLRPEAPER